MGGAERRAYRVCEWQRQQIEPLSENGELHAAESERPMFLRTSSREARLRSENERISCYPTALATQRCAHQNHLEPKRVRSRFQLARSS